MESLTERIEAFISSGSGCGYGDGYGSGCGYGDGCGDGSGDGCGSGSGDGSGDGCGYGDGSGYGSGCGYGDGSGSGSGCGDGGIKSYNCKSVYLVDGIQTIITAVKGNLAKGYIVNRDLTLTSCYIAENGNKFAHGKTLKEAVSALQDKILEDMSEEERVSAFMECHNYDGIYPVSDLYDWHHRLTGSCEMGRQQFAKDHGIDLDGKMSVKTFIELTKSAYGGEIIKQLEKEYKKGQKA